MGDWKSVDGGVIVRVGPWAVWPIRAIPGNHGIPDRVTWRMERVWLFEVYIDWVLFIYYLLYVALFNVGYFIGLLMYAL
jgi:hypothetical protein